ncbi:hypothetical protein KY314_04285 [Candidatus Woesearchaeota archaeon]|nr:hypothetical protein [Candidatus Woesearchaeota archaeon]
MSIFEKLGFKKKTKKSHDFGINKRPSRGDMPAFRENKIEGFPRNSPPLQEDELPGTRGDMPPLREHKMPDLARFEHKDMSSPSISAESGKSSFDLINSKLDTIKAVLDNINVRIEKLEKIAAGEEEVPRWR